MARIIRTLWFRERRWLEEPIITLPFIGDVEPRRLLFYGAPAALVALLVALQNGLDWFPALIASSVIGLTVTALAPGCTAWCPEEKLLAAFRSTAVGKRPPAKSRAARERRGADRGVARVVVAVGEPVRLEGVAVAPDGSPLVGAQVVAEVDGRRVAEARTDGSGRFSALLYLKPGHHVIRIVGPDGVVLYERRVLVELKEGDKR
ncbi:hypothetical protein Pyrfu_0345 [Pyrolobus fumarii 1A]|uniref:Carboxypeptidase regulatory-like domain-containing protein n=1 Tax=Pyrolobus fumarii (strain DSM 11204 / 1A) TaxID=694429 RepID=G0EFP6_PYRF1|nr:carboxypeptidase-like regulatory domain-containing protein [Pyrolobus fumarii]AEM38217.1 hypothetical protein Pyrfu_0345 [Pyrolobus fumarii 1A]